MQTKYLPITRLFLLIVTTVNFANASEIQIRGAEGSSYKIICTAESTKLFEFEGVSPKVHVISGRRLPTKCIVHRKESRGVGPIRIYFDFHFEDGVAMKRLTSDSPREVGLIEKESEKVIKFSYEQIATPYSGALNQNTDQEAQQKIQYENENSYRNRKNAESR